MAKPTVTPTFGTGTNYPADGEPEASTAIKILPAADILLNGWRPEEKPKAQNLNYILYWLCAWAAYIDAGLWEDDLNVTGNLDVDGNLNVDGTSQFDGAANFDGTVSLDDVAGTPNFTDTPTFAAGGTSSAAWTATEYKHTTSLQLPVSGWTTCADTAGVGPMTRGTGGSWVLSTGTSTNKVIVPFELPVGSRITGFEVYVTKTTDDTKTLSAQLYKCHDDGTETTAGTLVTNVQNAPGATAIISTEDITLATQHQYYVKVWGSGTTGDTVWRTAIFYDRP